MADQHSPPEIISRQEAKANRERAQLSGYPFYMGRQCKFGHDGLRYTLNSGCVRCLQIRQENSTPQQRATAVIRAATWAANQDPKKLRADANRRARLRYANDPKYLIQSRAYRRQRIKLPEVRQARTAYNLAWRHAHPENCKIYSQRALERRKTDINYRLAGAIRSRLNIAVKRGYRAGSAVHDLGCSIEEFRLYIEAQFEPDMSWENWGRGSGKWHLDHIDPLSNFDLTDRDQFLIACHYTNIRPLWSHDNVRRPRKSYSIIVAEKVRINYLKYT